MDFNSTEEKNVLQKTVYQLNDILVGGHVKGVWDSMSYVSKEVFNLNKQFFDDKFSRLDNKVNDITRDIREIKSGMSNMNGNIIDLDKRVDRLEIKVDRLETKVDRLEIKMDDSVKEIKASNSSVKWTVVGLVITVLLGLLGIIAKL